MATLVAADVQYIAQILYGCSGTVWHVAPSGNDSTGNGLSWIAPYLTPNKAATVAAAGDVIVVSGALTANSAINLQAGGAGQGISLVAAMGAPRPVLTFSLANAGYIRPGNRSVIRGIRTVGSAANFQYPIGLLQDDGSSAADDVLIEDCENASDTDWIFCDVTGCDRWTIRKNKIYTKWDNILSPSGATNWIIDDNDIVTVGPSAVTPAAAVHGLNLGTATGTSIRRNRIIVSGSTTDNRAIEIGSAGTAIVQGNILSTAGTNPYDFVNAGTIYDEGGNSGSSTGGALLTSGAGTITKRHAMATLGNTGLDYIIPETGYNARQVMALLLASMSGECDVTNNGGGSFTFVFKAPDDSTARVTITASNQSKERTAVTLSPPA